MFNPLPYFVTGIVMVIFGFGLYKLRHATMWMRGKVPINMKFTESNLFEIYLSLAVVMMRCEKRRLIDKRRHLQTYLSDHFPSAMSNFGSSYRSSFDMPNIKLKSACNWINKNIPDEGYKSQILYFLVGVAFVDGRLNRKEEILLQKLTMMLQLQKKTLISIIATHKETFERKYRKEQEQKRQQKEARKRRSGSFQKERMAKILEVDPDASFETIKKSYRRLVKQHHPDRFQNNGPEQIKMARERFIEIQHAYEYFENLNS